MRKPGFSNPEVRKRATELSKGVKRPRNLGKRTLIAEAKKEIIKDELIRSGYLESMKPHMGAIFKAHAKVAKMAKVGATAERKLAFEAMGIKKSGSEEMGDTIGQLLSDLANS